MDVVLSPEEINAYLEDVFPQLGGGLRAIHAEGGTLTAVMEIGDRHLRPGNTISGPTMFTLADCAFYMCALSVVGKKALTVTTSCTINFMRKPALGDLRAEARILKRGKSLIVGDVLIFGAGQEKPVAQASLTYSIPPEVG